MDSRRRPACAPGLATAQICLAPGDERRLDQFPAGDIPEPFGNKFETFRNMTMTDARKAVVLLSGGMDSCVCTAIARERHGVANIALLHAGYGQLTQDRERRAFTQIADFYGIPQRLVVQLDHFRAIGGSALTDKN